MTRGAARVLDPTAHGGPLTTGAASVLVNGKPAVRVGDHHGCTVHGPGPVVMGAPMVWIGGRPMAREGDLCMCIGAGGGTSEQASSAGGASVSGSVDPEKLEAKAKGEGAEWKGSAEEGKWKGDIAVAGGEIDGGISPAGVSGKGELYGVKGSGQYGDDDNNVGLEVKGGSADAEAESWAGEKDGKYGFARKESHGADAVAVKGRAKTTQGSGDYSLEETSEIGVALGVDTTPPLGVWAWVDPESGEICIGGQGEVEIFGVGVEFMKQYKFRWKPGGSGGAGGAGAIPNLIAAGSPDVLLG